MTQQQPPTSQERRNATRRSKHPYHMYDAIQRQPQAMAEMLTKHADRVTKVAATIKGKRRLYLVGIGTSWHAALVGEYWFRRMAPNSLEVQAWHSFEFHSYPPKVGPDDAVLVISHRGTKTYSFLALEQAKAAGAYTISITSNQPGQRIQVADDVLNTVDAEVSAAFTISYTSALMVLGMLASALTEEGSDRAAANAGLAKVPEVAGRVLSGGDSIREAADRFQDRKRFICVAAGPNTANAYEVALKMKETSRADSEGYPCGATAARPFLRGGRALPGNPGSAAWPRLLSGSRRSPGLSRRRGTRVGFGTRRGHSAFCGGHRGVPSAGGRGAVESLNIRSTVATVYLLPVPCSWYPTRPLSAG